MIKRHFAPSAPQAAFAPGIEAQAAQTFANLITIVEAAGYALSDAVFVRIYLTDFDRDDDAFNRVYLASFPTRQRRRHARRPASRV